MALRGLCALVHVFDMPASLRFYRDALGFDVTEASGTGDDVAWVRLRLGDAEIMLNTAFDEGERPAAADGARRAAHADTIFYFDCGDVDGAYAHLRAAGVKTQPPAVAPYGMKQLHVTDPDGYGLCFQQPVLKPKA